MSTAEQSYVEDSNFKDKLIAASTGFGFACAMFYFKHASAGTGHVLPYRKATNSRIAECRSCALRNVRSDCDRRGIWRGRRRARIEYSTHSRGLIGVNFSGLGC